MFTTLIYYILIPPLMLVFMIWSNQTPGPHEALALHRLMSILDAVLESVVVFPAVRYIRGIRIIRYSIYYDTYNTG